MNPKPLVTRPGLAFLKKKEACYAVLPDLCWRQIPTLFCSRWNSQTFDPNIQVSSVGSEVTPTPYPRGPSQKTPEGEGECVYARVFLGGFQFSFDYFHKQITKDLFTGSGRSGEGVLLIPSPDYKYRVRSR